MLVSVVRRSLIAGVLVVLAASAGGCGGDETGTQVAVDKEKSAALLNSMGGYSGYNKTKQGKSKTAPAPAPDSSPAPAPAPAPAS